jgi:hypothetical protein
MPLKWSYIGDLGPNGDLDWGGSSTSNIPRQGPSLPDNEDLAVYLRIKQLVSEGRFDGRWVDWGAVAIKVDGPGILEVLALAHGGMDRLPKTPINAAYVKYAEELGAGNFVAFIALEL